MRDAIDQRRRGILTYGITPPKRSHSEEKRRTIAQKQIARINTLPVDGLVVYDIQDESDRTVVERPFPFLEAIDPAEYAFDYLREVKLPKVVYRCAAPLSASELEASLERIEQERGLTVLVGAASQSQQVRLRLSEAYALKRSAQPQLPLGGVLIPERHAARGGEQERVLRKMDAGCSFFITQAVYSLGASKDVLSDLHYRCQALEVPVPPVLVTLSPCGSLKTLEFLRWLGISIPRWLENELTHAHDTLQTSIDVCADILEDLAAFAKPMHIPLGCNVESVSLRKAEIDASVELVARARKILGAADSDLNAS